MEEKSPEELEEIANRLLRKRPQTIISVEEPLTDEEEARARLLQLELELSPEDRKRIYHSYLRWPLLVAEQARRQGWCR